MTSTRATTRATGQFVRHTEGSKSLERGLALLRAFRHGTSSLSNSDLAEKSGIPRATVSRLTRSLVDSGFLQYDFNSRAYRLSPLVLSLSSAYENANQAPRHALPLMRKLATEKKVNVGLAVGDLTDMVYLASVRESDDSVSTLRKIHTGFRLPICSSSIGIAYLAGLSHAKRESTLAQVSKQSVECIEALRKRVEIGLREIESTGYCSVSFQPGHLLAVGSNFIGPDQQLYALNISYKYRSGKEREDREAFGLQLLRLITETKKRWLDANNRTGLATAE